MYSIQLPLKRQRLHKLTARRSPLEQFFAGSQNHQETINKLENICHSDSVLRTTRRMFDFTNTNRNLGYYPQMKNEKRTTYVSYTISRMVTHSANKFSDQSQHPLRITLPDWKHKNLSPTTRETFQNLFMNAQRVRYFFLFYSCRRCICVYITVSRSYITYGDLLHRISATLCREAQRHIYLNSERPLHTRVSKVAYIDFKDCDILTANS